MIDGQAGQGQRERYLDYISENADSLSHHSNNLSSAFAIFRAALYDHLIPFTTKYEPGVQEMLLDV
jgi:hypothetical protein